MSEELIEYDGEFVPKWWFDKVVEHVEKQRIWITNHPRPLESFWPRRLTDKYVAGIPSPTFRYSVEELQEMGYIGIYVEGMSREEYLNLPLIATKKIWDEKWNEK